MGRQESFAEFHYDTIAPHYLWYFENWEKESAAQARLIDCLIQNRLEADANHLRLLDCMAGIGTQCLGLASLGYTVTASDLSAISLQFLKQAANQRNLPIQTLKSDVLSLSGAFPTDSFDVVISFDNGIANLIGPETLQEGLTEIGAVLKPGGLVILGVRDYDSILKTSERPCYWPDGLYQFTREGETRYVFEKWEWERCGRIYNLRLTHMSSANEVLLNSTCRVYAYSSEDLSSALKKSGFKNIEILNPNTTQHYNNIVIGMKDENAKKGF